MAIDEERWTLSLFYEELFNYCFPVDYRMQLRRTLARCHQNDKSIAEYTYELQDLFDMIGDISERDQVLKFWNGVRPSIQKELWKNRLNLELSSWKNVVSQAEIIEIADNVAERRDRKPGLSAPPNSGQSKPKPSMTDGSVRAVAFTSRKHSRGLSRSQVRLQPFYLYNHLKRFIPYMFMFMCTPSSPKSCTQ